LNSVVSAEEIVLNRFVESPFAHPSVIFRIELIARHGGYREGDFPEDYELWLRWLDAGVPMAKVPERLLGWHDLPGRLSRKHPRYAVDAFYRIKAEYLARDLLRRASKRPLYVWGAGRPTRKRAELLRLHGVDIEGFVDIDPKKIGQRIGRIPVISPAQLPSPPSLFVLGYVGNRGARDLTRTLLADRGYVEGRDFLMCA
jgi:hypothetical protein